MSVPELLAPAGSPEALDAALGEGADAVYLGLKDFNARLRGANFAYSQYEAALRSIHKAGRKLYVTVNTVFIEREAHRVYQLLKYLAQTGPDGVIVQDFGILSMLQAEFPTLAVHTSTQMNVSSPAACELLRRAGARRAVLARELSAQELQSVRAGTELELEVFVHGALCVSASGLCLFSSFLGGKSANRGMCTQACRRLYESGNDAAAYYFSPRDLQLLEETKTLADLGINALKIEGRMKSAEYVAIVTGAYRQVLDNLDAPPDRYQAALAQAQARLRGDFARPKTSYLFGSLNPDLPVERALSESGRWLEPDQPGGIGILLGTIARAQGAGESRRVYIEQADAAIAAEAGDSIRLHSANDSLRRAHKVIFANYDARGLWLSAPDEFVPGDTVYLIQKRAARAHYAPAIPADLTPFKRKPGFDKAPEAPPFFTGKKTAALPEGIYVALSCIEDLYKAQSENPVAVLVPFNTKTAARLLDAKSLPFLPDRIYLSLDPIVTARADQFLAASLVKLTERGYRTFIAQNVSHLDILARAPQGVRVIAGSWLYSFNRAAASRLARWGAAHIITPWENSRQNLEKTFTGPERRHVFVTVFGYPPLFRFRADVAALYPFRQFTDSTGAAFRLTSLLGDAQGSAALVQSEEPVSLVDKVRFMREAGFRRFIFDLSGRPLNKTEYRDLFKQAQSGGTAPGGANRFNWKNGFYTKDAPSAASTPAAPPTERAPPAKRAASTGRTRGPRGSVSKLKNPG